MNSFPTPRSQMRCGKPTPVKPQNSAERSLQQREEEIKIQENKLKLAWKKLNSDIKKLEEKRSKVNSLKDELKKYEDANQSKIILENNEENSFLTRTRYDLEQQKVIAEKECEIEDMNPGEIFESENLPEIISIISSLIERIDNVLMPREAEVIKMEYEAQEHQVHYQEFLEAHKEITRKKIAAITEKGRLLAVLDDIKTRNEKLENNRKNAEEKLENAKKEAKNLEQQEKELQQLEEETKNKEAKVEELRKIVQTMKQERQEAELKRRIEEDEQLNKVVALPKFENDELDARKLQLNEEKSKLEQREEMLNLQIAKSRDVFEKQKSELETAIKFFESRISQSESIKEEAEKNKQHVTELEQQLKEKETERESLDSMNKTDEELQEKSKNIEEESKELDALEKELQERAQKLSKDEEDIEQNEEQAKFNYEDALNEKKMVEANEIQINKKLAMYETALQTANIRRESLIQTIQNMKQKIQIQENQ